METIDAEWKFQRRLDQSCRGISSRHGPGPSRCANHSPSQCRLKIMSQVKNWKTFKKTKLQRQNFRMKLDSQDEIQTFLCYGKSAAFQCCVVVKSSYWPLDGNSYIGRKSLKQNKIQNTSNKVNHIKFTDTFCYIHVHLSLKQSDFGNMKQKKSRTHAPEIQSCECKSNSPITNMKPNHSPHSPKPKPKPQVFYPQLRV